MRLGQTITDIRKQRGMTQEEFARIFNVTRQTVSNWEKEKNYPDLETLIRMSEEFNISLDVMLKEDTQMVNKLNMQIKFSQRFKKNAIRTLIVIVAALALAGIGWGIAWNKAKDSSEAKFQEGVEKHGFRFDEQLGYYTKVIDTDTYYVLPNQSMPDYFKFVLHYYSRTLDYYTVADGKNIWIRWVIEDKDSEMMHSISYLYEDGKFDHQLSEKEEKELCAENPDISAILEEGEEICRDAYER